MSQEINNREYRKNVIKDLLRKLHEGQTVDDVKHEFDEAFSGVSASEISEAEQALIAEGLLVQEVQRLCDVHAAVFKGSIEEIHAPADASQMPGHPAHTLKAENRALEQLITEKIRPALQAFSDRKLTAEELAEKIETLKQIDKHYLRKENLFFPYMEQYGITAPPKVMWGVDDEIRALIKEAIALAKAGDKAVGAKLEETLTRIEEMIFKEDNILLPMLLETLTPQEWKNIADESDELGYCLIDPPVSWQPTAAADAVSPPTTPERGDIALPTGFLSATELTHLLNTLPVDITFVGKDDTVRYFSQGAERVFPRTKAIIGREVANCHPPASVHIVEGIIADLKSGKKDHEDFWIKMGGKYIYIRYFAVRDEKGEYLGVLEVTQDIASIQQIEGEKRLVSE
ncbi:MAG: DUF438 domain-containing protein [Lachnospiraceae bacterium]|nr:DUF438 domain-containing protein [Lachnospiraceae bacterium]